VTDPTSSRRTYRALVDSLPDIVFRLDQQRRFTFVSSAGERVLGLPVTAVVGQRVDDNPWPPPVRHAIEAAGESALGGDVVGRADATDRGRYYRVRVVREREESTALLGVIEDVTAARSRNQRRRVHDEAVRAMNAAADDGELADAVFAAARDLGVASGLLALRMALQPYRFEVFHCGDCLAAVREVTRVQGDSSLLPILSILHEREPVWIGEPTELSARYPAAEAMLAEHARPAWVCLPLVAEGDVIGLLHLSFDAVRTYETEERRLFLALAEECGRAVQRRRAGAAGGASPEAVLESNARLRREAEVLERALGVVGHDLRSPLSAIILTAESMIETKPTRDVVRIRRSAMRMQRMITEILDVTKVRHAGGLPVEPQRCDLAELIADQVDELKRVHPDRELQVDLAADGHGIWDPTRISELLSNLIGNAIEHGAEGPISIRLTGDDDEVIVRIANRGAIAAADRDRIFEPFRACASERKSAGLGLGLFISRAIVEAHGGSIEATCGEDETAIVVRLPRAFTLSSPPGSGLFGLRSPRPLLA
jgi:PAS domain S-box-containing protein